MQRDDPTAKLERLHQAAERVSANLVELEVDSRRQMLATTDLEGESAARWAAASAALTELWRRQGLLEGLLQRADRLRRRDELRDLLDGPSIELAIADVPLEQRTLLGDAQLTERCSADELLAGMSAAFDQVKATVATIGGAWESLIPKLSAVRELVQDCVRLQTDLGESGSAELESAQLALGRLSNGLTVDPLAVVPAEIEALSRTAQRIHDDLDAVASLKREFDARMIDARALLGRVRGAVDEARAAHEELARRISAPAPSAPPEIPGELAGRLERVVELERRGEWREAARMLESWTSDAAALLDGANRAREASRAPIQARNQLRSLLEAYQVKAARLGLAEDRELAEMFDRAHEALYTAPTDLTEASRLVRSYQRELSTIEPTPEAMR